MANRKHVLITGASSGIGWELAFLFAAKCYDLTLVARSEEKLRNLSRELETKYPVRAYVLAADLTDPQAPKTICNCIKSDGHVIDVLVNNAGFGLAGDFAITEWQRERDMLQVNVTAVTELTKHVVPSMVQQGFGRILNVASTAAFQPGPLMAVYYATKAYVLSLSEALAEELTGTGVTVTALCPGATETGFKAQAGLENSRLFKAGTMDAKTVARAGFEGLMAGKRLIIPGLRNRLLSSTVRFVPRSAVLKIVKRLNAV